MSALTSIPGVEMRSLPTADITGMHDVVDTLARIVVDHGTLYDWAAERPQPRALRGRAPVFVATLPDRDETVVVRHSWHGGLLAPITSDLFRAPTRAPMEMLRSHMLQRVGIPTSDVIGFARYSALPGFYRVDVVTRFIPDAYDLGMVAAGLAPQIERDDALAATKALLVKLAAHGVSHPDLNVKNVLLRQDKRGAVEAIVIDVDVVQWNPTRPPIETMRANTARLIRSMRKWRTHFGCDVAETRMQAFEQDALAATPPLASMTVSDMHRVAGP